LQASPGFLVIVLGSSGIGWGILIWLVTLITERVRAAEREDRQLQEQLAGTLAELQASEKERMLYRRTMTHELRSPITATQSMLRLLVSGHMGPLDKKQMGMVRKSLVRLDQMMNMLQDLLDLERGKSRGEEQTTFRLKPIMAELITVYYPPIEEAEMSLDVQIDNEITAFGNPGDIKSILSNLISNAVKYNRPGGAIRIKVTPLDNKVEISVADTGIGIPASAKERLFTEFFRAANAKSHNPYGTGLGLAIVSSLIHKNNGEIHMESEEGKGTVFTVTLPRVEPA
jgi:signal transduction histidine kinase